MDPSGSKDAIEAGANSPSRPLRCRAQPPRRELGRVSPARRLTMSRSELNRDRDDASASGGGAGAAHEDPGARGRADGAKVLGTFAGSKNDGEDLLTGQRFLATKGSKNDGAEFLGTGRMFLAAKGSKNDGAEFLGTRQIFLAAKCSKNEGAEFLGTGRRFLAAKGSKNDGAEAEEVLGAFAGSKKANTVKATAGAERVNGVVLGALAERAAAAFFEATPAVPHDVGLTEKRRLPSPSPVSITRSHYVPQCQTLPSQCAQISESKPQSSKRGRPSSCSGYQCRSTSMMTSKDPKVMELKNVAKVHEQTEAELQYDLLWKGVQPDKWIEKAQDLAKADIAPATTEQKVPQHEHIDQENTNDTTIATSKGLDASSRKSEAVTIPHPLWERATLDLVKTNKIQDVNSVQNWLIEKELESDENYFMRIGTDDEKKLWQRVRACPNVFDQKVSGRRLNPLKMATNKNDIMFLYRQMRKSGSTLDIREIAHLSMQGLSEIINFLCRNCFLGDEKADRVALELLSGTMKDTAATEAIGSLPGFIATVVLRSFLGNAESQRLSLQILILLSRKHLNKLKIIRLGGFRCALWHVSQRHAVMGCRLMASLMDAEEGFVKFIKDGASSEIVNLTVKNGRLTPWISAVIEGLRGFPLGRTKFIEAVSSLPSKEVFVQQRLTWCLLDFVEEDERYCHDDTLED